MNQKDVPAAMQLIDFTEAGKAMLIDTNSLHIFAWGQGAPVGSPASMFYFDMLNKITYVNVAGVWTIEFGGGASPGGFSGIDVFENDGDDIVIGRLRLAAGETVTVTSMGVTRSDGVSTADIKLIAKKDAVAFVTTNNDGAEQLTSGNTATGAGLITFHIANDSGTDALLLSGFARFTVK